MPGPRPMPVPLKLLRGNPGRRSIRPGFEPPKLPVAPDLPAFLTGYAAEEWRRITPSLCLLGLLADADVMPLSAYCEAYKRWRTAVEALDSVAAVDPSMHGLLVRGSERQAKCNPLVQIAAQAANDMIRFAAEFGFSPAARARISAGPPSGPSKFAGLLAE
jgi:P27 family predicted phage terminase small subunit